MILITGASGFLGQRLVQHIAAGGKPARALYYAHAPAADIANLPGIEWMKADLLDVYDVEAAMQGVTEIYHCAAIVSFDPGRRNEMLHFNPESTANIVNQALIQDVRKMVYISSIAALGRTGENTKTISEDAEWGESRYNSAYGISKYIAEMEVWRGIGEGLNAVIVNPGIILGASNGRDLSSRLMHMANREFPFYSNGVTSWVYAGDVVRIITRLMESDISGERFIVSEGNTSYKDIFTMMAGALNKKAPRYYAGSFLTALAWRASALAGWLTGKPSLITRETVNNANSICLYENNKLLNALQGFSYTPVKDAVNVMAQSFLAVNKK
jgi:nucleoside-diphosphate-sugar epimerase